MGKGYFTCVKSDDCTKEVLDGTVDLAFVSSNSMAKNGEFKGSCLAQNTCL